MEDLLVRVSNPLAAESEGLNWILERCGPGTWTLEPSKSSQFLELTDREIGVRSTFNGDIFSFFGLEFEV